MHSRRRIAWTAGLLQGLLSGTVSTIVITLGAPRIGRARALDWMEIGTVLLGADSVQIEPRWWHIAAGVLVHQAADLSWALVFFALGRHWTLNLGARTLLILALPWAVMTAAIEYHLILPWLQPLVVMQVPFWTALGVHVTSGLLYPFFPQVLAMVTRQSVRWDAYSRTVAAALGAGLIVLSGLEVLARADREPSWPLTSMQERASDMQFLRHMEAHHTVGVELATLAASNAGDPELRRLGRLMVANQAGEIRIIARWCRSWIDGPLPPMSAEERAAIPGMPQPQTIAQLSAERGDRFDSTFVSVMVAHHHGAIQMADDAWRTAADPRVRLLADSIRHAQRRQISAMASTRTSE
jgi:uncharacterized protein (DUF305 family)